MEQLCEGEFWNVKDLGRLGRDQGVIGLWEYLVQRGLSRESDLLWCGQRAMMCTTRVTQTGRRALAVEPLVWTGLVAVLSRDKEKDAGCLTEECDKHQNKKGSNDPPS